MVSLLRPEQIDAFPGGRSRQREGQRLQRPLPHGRTTDATCVVVALIEPRRDPLCPALPRAERSVSIYLMRARYVHPQDLTPRQKILLAEYQELCKSHSGITDFRAKLLAFLPIASGTGVGLLVFQSKSHASDAEAGLLIGLGIFGAVVTIGLFLYELRQIDVCKQLRNHAAGIERQLGIEAGQFGGRRGRLSLSDIYSPDAHRDRDRRLTALEAAGQRPPQGELQSALSKKSFVGAEAAGYLIYHSVIAAWLFVAALGVAELA